jgi:hypothetical protein
MTEHNDQGTDRDREKSRRAASGVGFVLPSPDYLHSLVFFGWPIFPLFSRALESPWEGFPLACLPAGWAANAGKVGSDPSVSLVWTVCRAGRKGTRSVTRSCEASPATLFPILWMAQACGALPGVQLNDGREVGKEGNPATSSSPPPSCFSFLHKCPPPPPPVFDGRFNLPCP